MNLSSFEERLLAAGQRGGENTLFRFLTNLFLLFDHHPPPHILQSVNHILFLLEEGQQ